MKLSEICYGLASLFGIGDLLLISFLWESHGIQLYLLLMAVIFWFIGFSIEK